MRPEVPNRSACWEGGATAGDDGRPTALLPRRLDGPAQGAVSVTSLAFESRGGAGDKHGEDSRLISVANSVLASYSEPEGAM